MEYTVEFTVTGRYKATVFGEDFDDAKDKAIEKFYDADFGELTDIEGDTYSCEDEKGRITYLV